MGGCSGENLAKAESTIEAMADGEGKIAAQKEVAQAQDAMLGGKMGACADASQQGDARAACRNNPERTGAGCAGRSAL